MEQILPDVEHPGRLGLTLAQKVLLLALVAGLLGLGGRDLEGGQGGARDGEDGEQVAALGVDVPGAGVGLRIVTENLMEKILYTEIKSGLPVWNNFRAKLKFWM